MCDNKKTPLPLTIEPAVACDLDDLATDVPCEEYDKETALERMAANAEAMADISRRLYAENKRSVLLVLQGVDAAGKDSTIRTVTRGMNPRSLVVHSFKVPSDEEIDHDFLWRIHARVPSRGEIGIFNRSHYEDVLVVRVHDLSPGTDWPRRFRQINDFEKMLAEEGTVIVKCYLHISRDEQRERLQARMDNPDDHWKVNLRDLEERKLWDKYRAAYNDAITHTNTSHAPWYIIPADRKWYRTLIVSELLLGTLRDMDPQYPAAEQDYGGIVVG